jgi:hypothetical protein
MKNNSTVFCGLPSVHFNDSESNDSFSKQGYQVAWAEKSQTHDKM